ncbi:MAG: GxxExxY protein [Prevotella sp.]|nr:GxxExxY protein [Prevotella sp.]
MEQLPPIHYKQILTYLKIAQLRLGLLVNFNVIDAADGIHRVIHGYE